MNFLGEGSPELPLVVAGPTGADPRGSLDALPGSRAAPRSIWQGVMVVRGISGRVLNTVEIAPRCNIAICEFRVSFRGAPAY